MEYNFETVRKNTNPLMIIKQFIKSLEEEKMQPGERLPPERELAKMFGVGRSSMREAIRVLVVMGYLEVIQGNGSFVCKNLPDRGDYLQVENILASVPMFDLMEARQVLEISAAKFAAERAEIKHIRKMQKAVARMEEGRDDIPKFIEADLEFHMALAEASDNVFINQMMKKLIKEVHKYRVNFMPTSHQTKDSSIATAKEIISMVTDGEGEKAAALISHHLSDVDTALRKVITEGNKEGGSN
ncbi:MAG TPA: FadR/GntR family transcriptional regulator [Desulfosporosinus sp.]|nr:FadR/GntR family transcriptional regulator [Desulfosporosinus sp.]